MINPTKTYNKSYLLWQKLPLKDFCKKCTIKNIDRRYNTVFTNSAIHGVIKQSDYFEKDVANSENTDSYYVVHPEDFIYNPRISENAPYGPIRTNETEECGVVSPLYFVFRLVDKKVANYDYLKYYFASSSWHRYVYSIGNNGARSDRMNISDADFMVMPVALPPLEEQRKIAEILVCCDRLIAEKKKQKKALMQKLLNPDSGFRLPGFSGEWKKTTLGKLATNKGDYGINAPACEYSPGLPRYIRITDIDEHCKFISSNEAYVRVSEYQDFLLKPSDIVFVRTGGTVGKSYIYDPKDGDLVFAGFLIRFNFQTPQADCRFIKQIVSTEEYLHWINIMSARSGQPGINAEEYASYNFHAPSLNEQQAIADILSAADKEIDLLEQELVQQEQKKKSLMQLLLTGIVRV